MQEAVSRMEVTSKYQIRHHSVSMDADEALEFMRSDFLGLYTTARREEDGSIALQVTSLICPYCGSKEQLKASGKITNEHLELMEKWADPQLIMPDDIPKEIIFLNTDIEEFRCPHCGVSSGRKDNRTTISVIRRKKSVLLRCEVHDLSRILTLPHMPEQTFSLKLPLYEQLEFNIGKGRVCVRISDDEGNVLRTQDVTNSPRWLSKTALSEWFDKSAELRGIILAEFQTASKEVVPFNLYNITLEDLLFFTRFIGYEQSFYDAIPYELDTHKLDDSFACLQELHTKKSAIAYLRSFSLAKFKSIRKQILESPGLLFYLPQCELLLQAFGDVNLFRNILTGNNIFYILSALKQSPVLAEFLLDYCKVMGAAALCKSVMSEWYWSRQYGAHYCSLNAEARRVEQYKWRHERNCIEDYEVYPYSLPQRCKPPKDVSCVIDGFTFLLLGNTAACRRAGRELHNCLQRVTYESSVIIAVCCGKVTVAAIDVFQNEIRQAYTFHNGCIRSIDGLEPAIAKWAERNSLSFCSKDFTEDW